MKRNYFFYIAVVLTISITLGSLISFKPSHIITVHFSDKIVHVFGYCLLTLSWLIAYKLKTKQLKFSILISVFVFVYGIIIEVLQGILANYRHMEMYDIFSNFVGIVIAFIFFNIIFQKN